MRGPVGRRLDAGRAWPGGLEPAVQDLPNLCSRKVVHLPKQAAADNRCPAIAIDATDIFDKLTTGVSFKPKRADRERNVT